MAAKKPNPAPKPSDQAILAAAMALVRGEDQDAVMARIVRMGVTLDDAGLVLVEARKRIQLAADFHRDEQLGLAIRRLNMLIERNMGEEGSASDFLGNHAVALRAQIELNKLLRLHEVGTGATGDPDEATDRVDELSRARGHLAPLFAGVPHDYPLSELARMAAEKVRTAYVGEDEAG